MAIRHAFWVTRRPRREKNIRQPVGRKIKLRIAGRHVVCELVDEEETVTTKARGQEVGTVHPVCEHDVRAACFEELFHEPWRHPRIDGHIGLACLEQANYASDRRDALAQQERDGFLAVATAPKNGVGDLVRLGIQRAVRNSLLVVSERDVLGVTPHALCETPRDGLLDFDLLERRKHVASISTGISQMDGCASRQA